MALITMFATSRFASLFAPCKDPCGCGGPPAEWPNNVLSTRLVVFDSGVIAREGDRIDHRVDAGELERCDRLARAAESIMSGQMIGMRSDGDAPLSAYFQVANVGAVAPQTIDSTLVRRLFGGTICPTDAVCVAPLAETGLFWEDLGETLENYDDAEAQLDKWRALIRFFSESKELVSPSFAYVGFAESTPPDGSEQACEEDPEGFEMRGSCLPRLAFAFTRAGSLVGLLSHVVWT